MSLQGNARKLALHSHGTVVKKPAPQQRGTAPNGRLKKIFIDFVYAFILKKTLRVSIILAIKVVSHKILRLFETPGH
ncbi:hypothetical protein GGQ19_000019 [Salinibacter ruber]|nr:hypothetical protein [Salinibacter ruber]